MAGRGRKGGKVGTAGKGKPPHRADRADRAGWTGRAGNDGAGKAGGAGRAAGTVVALSVVVRTFRSAVAGLLRDWRSAHLQVGRSPSARSLCRSEADAARSPKPVALRIVRATAVGGVDVPVEPTSRGGTALPRRPVGGDAPSAGKPARRVERTPADRCPVCRLRRRAPTARRCRPRRLPVRRGALRLWRWTVVVRTFRSAFALPEEACGLRRA